MNGSEPYGDGSSRKEPIRRPRKACTTCRALKTRCLPDGDNQDPKSCCSRCARLNLNCVYDRGRRGKRKSEDNFRSSPLSAGPSSTPHMHHRVSLGSPDPRLGWKALPTLPHEGYRTNDDVSMHQMWADPAPASVPWPATSDTSRAGYPPYPAPMTAATSFPAEHGETRASNLETNTPPRVPPPYAQTLESETSRTTFVDYVEPLMSRGHRATTSSSPRTRPREKSQNRDNNPFPSPVDLGLLSEPEAQHLFHQFMFRIAPCSYLFDPQYHTFERVRESGVLLTAIMYPAARFFRPDIEDAIHSLTEHLICRSIMQGRVDLQLVQAICVVVYWKHPRDKTFYQKLGIASRLICELRYSWPSDLTRRSPASSEEEERRQVDIERTVHNVNGLDLAYSFLLELPPYHKPWMPKAAHVLEWAEAHRHLNITADFFKAFISTFWEFYGTFGGHPRMDVEEVARKMPADVYQSAEQRVNAEVQRWTTTHCSLLEGQYAALGDLLMKTTLLKVRVVGFLRHTPGMTSTLIFNSAEDIGDVVKRVTESGDIIFWSDIMSATVSTAGAHLYTLRNRLSLSERQHAAGFCHKIANYLCPTLTTGGETTLRYIERFYRNLSKAFEDLCNGVVGGEDANVTTALSTLLQYRGHAAQPTVVDQNHSVHMNSAISTGQPQEGGFNFLWPDMSAPWMEQGHAPPG